MERRCGRGFVWGMGRLLLAWVAVAWLGASFSVALAEGPRVRLAMSTWVGYAPFHVAAEKGLFRKQGVDVEILVLESVADRRSALAANRIQGFATTVDTHVITAASGIDVVQVLALDDSYGGDGLVARKEFRSLQDLKGKSVGLHTLGGASFFWFLYLLDREGLTLQDFNVINLTAGDAGAAFVAGRLDAAVTWEPWLGRAKQSPHGQVLIDSKQTPGVIVDSLGLRRDFVAQNPGAVRAIVRAWYDALEYMRANPADANRIMARAMGQTVPEFEATLGDVRFYGPQENLEYFGSPQRRGLIYDVTGKAVELYLKHGIIDRRVDAASLIDPSFVR